MPPSPDSVVANSKEKRGSSGPRKMFNDTDSVGGNSRQSINTKPIKRNMVQDYGKDRSFENSIHTAPVGQEKLFNAKKNMTDISYIMS